MGRERWVADAAFAGLVGALVVLGYVQGLQPLPLGAWAVPEAAVSIGFFAAFMGVSGVLFLARLQGGEDRRPLDEPVTVIVPTYRDANVLHRSVQSALESTHDVHVIVVCEPDDAPGTARARSLSADQADVSVLVNPNPGSKAGAINAAVAAADTDHFALLDADQEVSPGFIARASGHLRDCDVVQSRFVTRPTGFVESLIYYEYLLFNYTFRQLLYAVSDFRMATSKAMLFTRDAFERADGYDTDVIAEDHDFAHQCYQADLSVRLLYDETVSEEAAHSLRDWWGQRKRWMTGNVEVLHGLVTDIRTDYRDPRAYVSLAVGLVSVLGSFFLLSLVPKVLVLLQQGDLLLAASPLLALYPVAIAARYHDDIQQPRVGWVWLLVPFLLPFFSLITVRAFTEYFLTFDGEWFTVEKGEPE